MDNNPQSQWSTMRTQVLDMIEKAGYASYATESIVSQITEHVINDTLDTEEQLLAILGIKASTQTTAVIDQHDLSEKKQYSLETGETTSNFSLDIVKSEGSFECETLSASTISLQDFVHTENITVVQVINNESYGNIPSSDAIHLDSVCYPTLVDGVKTGNSADVLGFEQIKQESSHVYMDDHTSSFGESTSSDGSGSPHKKAVSDLYEQGFNIGEESDTLLKVDPYVDINVTDMEEKTVEVSDKHLTTHPVTDVDNSLDSHVQDAHNRDNSSQGTVSGIDIPCTIHSSYNGGPHTTDCNSSTLDNTLVGSCFQQQKSGAESEQKYISKLDKVKKFECTTCGKRYYSNQWLKNHMLTHAHKPFECTTCGERFQSNSRLQRHLRTHTGEKPFEYATRSRRFQNNSHLQTDNKTHTDLKPFECATCGKKFGCNSDLQMHIKNHSGEKPFECTTCGKRFLTKSNLQSHIRIKHAGKKKQFECTTCGKIFRCNYLLQRHVRARTDKPFEFECTTCGKRFVSESVLRNHSRCHTGKKPFKCTTCGKRYGTKPDLRIHIRSHTGEKPYECTTCGKRFVSNSDLHKHTRFHTGKKPFECTTCGKRFVSRFNFQRHSRSHTGEKPFQCATCGMRSVCSVALKKHIIRAHKVCP